MADRRESTNDQGVLLRGALDGQQAGLWTALPGIISKFNAGAQTCEVQPAIKAQVLAPDGTKSWVSLPLLVDCPVVFPGGGGFTLTFPMAVGDECLVIFASRCIDSWWQSGGVQVQAELRMHDLSDGFVLPSPRSQPRMLNGGVNPTDVELRNDTGTRHISIKPNGTVEVIAEKVEAYAATSALVSSPDIHCIGNVRIDGNLQVNGDVVATGTATAADFITPTLPSYIAHIHGGIRRDTVNQNTNPPLPGT